MNTISVSTTKLKNDVSGIMKKVFKDKKTVLIKRYGKLLGKIVPATDNKKVNIDKFFGVIPDFPDIIKNRVNSTRVVDFNK